MTAHDTQSIFLGGPLGETEREGDAISDPSPFYFRLVNSVLTLGMFSMLGSILFVMALPSEAAFFEPQTSTTPTGAEHPRTPYMRLINAIHPLPAHVYAACGLKGGKRRLFTVLSTLYYAIHCTLFVAVIMAVIVMAAHLERYAAPFPRTGRDCLGTWTSSAGEASPTYREGWAWNGTPPYFNTTAHPGILSEDQLAEHTYACWLTGTHTALPMQRDMFNYDASDATLPTNVERVRAGDGVTVISSESMFATFIEILIATNTVGIVLPLILILTGVPLAYRWCSCGCGRGKAKSADTTTIDADSMVFADVEMEDQSIEGFLEDAGVSSENVDSYAGCFKAGGLTTASPRALCVRARSTRRSGARLFGPARRTLTCA